MPKLGSKDRPTLVRVQTQERAGETAAICDQHRWYFIAGPEPDKPEGVRDLENALPAVADTGKGNPGAERALSLWERQEVQEALWEGTLNILMEGIL